MRRTERRPEDGGATLVELMVGMTVMAVVMAMFVTSAVQMYRAINKIQSVAAAQSQVAIAFQRLDKEVRYAEGISAPSTSSPWYVEFVTANTGTAICTQLWLDTTAGQLKRREWTQGGSYARVVGVPIATGVTSAQPFTVSNPDSTYNVQRLRINLTATSGSGADKSSRDVNVMFTAMNTSLSTSSATVCSEGRTIPW